MKYFTRLIARLAFLVLLCMIFSKKVYAYLDPGTGSYLFQMLIAGLIGGSFAIKLYWRRIKSFFSGSRSTEKELNKHDDK